MLFTKLVQLGLGMNMERIEEMFKDISGRLQLIDNKFGSLLKRMTTVKQDNKVLLVKVMKLESSIEYLERKVRSNNSSI